MLERYFITFAAIDSEYGNYPWHNFMLLSKMEEGKKMEVIDNYGYYASPSTDRTSRWGRFKVNNKLDVDFWGNHGMLKHEELRFLDCGKATHGYTIEFTEEVFNALHDECKTIIADQKQAIKEVVVKNNLKVQNKGRKRNYDEEEHAKFIYEEELKQAKKENRLSRLRPFEFNFFSPNKSHTCKTGLIDILEKYLTEEQINRLTHNGYTRFVPYFSGPEEEIFLHSEGTLLPHKRASGKTEYYRNGDNPEVKVYWTLPPQKGEMLDSSTKSYLTVSGKYYDEAKSLIKKLQGLEWLLINSAVDQEQQEHKTALIARIKAHYEAFSVITAPKVLKPITGIKGTIFSLLSLPENLEEKAFLEKINRGEQLIRNLYAVMAFNVNTQDCPTDEGTIAFESPIIQIEDDVVCHLSQEDKEKFCKIIGRSYPDPDEESLSEEDTLSVEDPIEEVEEESSNLSY